jgi:hypothetical protein
MYRKSTLSILAVAALLSLGSSAGLKAEENSNMTFFVASEGVGDGANLGGLAGADAHCQKLAEGAGAGQRTWRAYLSAVGAGSAVCINARDRIGTGPWQNAKGVTIANNVDELHSDGNAINKGSALDEDGDEVNGVGDNPNQHDILTGSTPEGRCFPPGTDTTCGNWTKNGAGAAQVGHHDRTGLDNSPSSRSWNSSHSTRGCSQSNLESTGGAGLLYCFAIN